MITERLQSHKAQIAVALALAAEWALAFAFAKRFADAIAYANVELEDVPRLRELEARVAVLEDDHGLPRPTPHDPPRRRSRTVEGSRG